MFRGIMWKVCCSSVCSESYPSTFFCHGNSRGLTVGFDLNWFSQKYKPKSFQWLLLPVPHLFDRIHPINFKNIKNVFEILFQIHKKGVSLK